MSPQVRDNQKRYVDAHCLQPYSKQVPFAAHSFDAKYHQDAHMSSVQWPVHVADRHLCA